MVNVNRVLEQYKIRNTAARREILEAILSLNTRHFSAEDILGYLKRNKKRTSRASVFRALALFSRKRLIKSTDLVKNFTLYEFTFNLRHHDHLYCVRCGKIIEFEEERIETLQELVCQKNKFHPLQHNLKITGLCAKCRRACGEKEIENVVFGVK